MRSVFYRRCSTDEQAESGAGLKAQLDACVAHAERAGMERVGDFSDEGIGGAAPMDKRPGLLEAQAMIGPGDVLLVAKRDRLGRDPIVVAMIEAAVNRQGGRVVSAAGEGTDEGTDDDPTSVLMRRIVDAFAEYERLVIKSRTRAALSAKRRRGQRTGSVPIGFDPADIGERSKAGLPVALVPNPAEVATMALVRELRAAGMPLRRIARALDERGIPPKQGGPAGRTPPSSGSSNGPRRPRTPPEGDAMKSKMKAATTDRRAISYALRAAIEADGRTAYGLGRDSEVEPGVIQRFLNGERTLALPVVDRLSLSLGLKLLSTGRGRGRPAKRRAAETPGERSSEPDGGDEVEGQAPKVPSL
jgi:DNA invertase Pin-like site-specific DNA recombinase